ncbi:MAG: arylamine N-acetyltransferase [Pseudomonadota bacterium]
MPFQQLNKHELQQYFQRIDCATAEHATLSTLENIHRQHALTIPFENLNPFLSLPVVLTKDELMQKLVFQKRGGYCFEHNLLLGHVLTTLGFAVKGLAARVNWMLAPDVVMPRTHMVLLVTLNETQYLADVGFGGLTLPCPLLINTDATQATSHEAFRIQQKEQDYSLSVQLNDVWQDMFTFTLDSQTQPDYEMANWFVATHPQSRFVNNLIAARVDTDGRHALQNQHYTRYYLNKPHEKTELLSPGAILSTLHDQFHIETANLPELAAKLEKIFAKLSQE